jgi:hypothetical protein
MAKETIVVISRIPMATVGNVNRGDAHRRNVDLNLLHVLYALLEERCFLSQPARHVARSRLSMDFTDQGFGHANVGWVFRGIHLILMTQIIRAATSSVRPPLSHSLALLVYGALARLLPRCSRPAPFPGSSLTQASGWGRSRLSISNKRLKRLCWGSSLRKFRCGW